MALRPVQHSRARKSGFTLIEIMVVIAILMILMGLAVAIGSNVQQKAKIQQTKKILGVLDGALTAYEADAGGTAPQTGTDYFLPAFAQMPGSKAAMASLRPYINPSNSNEINDAFGKPITLVAPPNAPKLGFQSLGPDGILGTTDDIFSWDPAQ